jgi:hypothetical protein
VKRITDVLAARVAGRLAISWLAGPRRVPALDRVLAAAAGSRLRIAPPGRSPTGEA